MFPVQSLRSHLLECNGTRFLITEPSIDQSSDHIAPACQSLSSQSDAELRLSSSAAAMRLSSPAICTQTHRRKHPQLILPPAPGVSNEGGSSELLVALPAASWPWVLAWGSLEPPRRDGGNAQKTGESGGKMGEIRSKTCEQGRDRRNQLAGGFASVLRAAAG